MAIPTVAEVEEFKVDLDDAEAIVNGFSTVTTRLGGDKLSLSQAISNILHGDIAAYSAAATYTLITEWVTNSGIVYRPIPSELPIGPETFDSSKWIVVQGLTINDKIYPPVDSYTTLRGLDSSTIQDGTVITLTNDGIAGTFKLINITSHGLTDNGGTIIVIDSDWYAKFQGFSVKTNNSGFELDVTHFGAVYGIGLTQSQQEANTDALQRAINNLRVVKISGILETYGKVIIPDRTKISGQSPLGIGIWGKHPTENTIECIDIATGVNDSTQGVTIDGVSILSDNSNCIKACPYQWTIRDCRFTSNNGISIWAVGNDLISNNTFDNCIFFGYTYGIYTSNSDLRGFTDNTVSNCKFDGEGGNEISAIDIGRPAGTVLRDNHYWREHAKEFVVLRGGQNCRLVSEYFEGMINPRIRIEGGNPSVHSIVACNFWLGDGTDTDWEGDPTSLIVFSVNQFNQNSITVSACNFVGGTNTLPVFKILNAPAGNEIQNARICFDRSNNFSTVSSSAYKLSTYNSTSTGSGWVFDSDHPGFKKIETADSNFAIVFKDWTELIWRPVAETANRTVTIPSEHEVVLGRKVRITNMNSAYTLNISSSSGDPVIGLNPIPSNRTVWLETDGTNFLVVPG